MKHQKTRITSQYSGIVLTRQSSPGLEFCVVEYTKKNNQTSIKFPGGMMEEEDNGNPFETFKRECLEETGVVVGKANRFFSSIGPDKDNGGLHRKSWFTARLPLGQGIFTSSKQMKDPELKKPPFWITAKELANKIDYWHQAPYIAAVSYLGRYDPESKQFLDELRRVKKFSRAFQDLESYRAYLKRLRSKR